MYVCHVYFNWVYYYVNYDITCIDAISIIQDSKIYIQKLDRKIQSMVKSRLSNENAPQVSLFQPNDHIMDCKNAEEQVKRLYRDWDCFNSNII